MIEFWNNFDLKKRIWRAEDLFWGLRLVSLFCDWLRQLLEHGNTNRTFIWIQHQSGLQLDPENTVKIKMKSDSSNSSHNSRKKIIKESPDPPPRELVLASPDLVLKSGSRLSLETFRIYFDCLGPKRMLIENNRTR